MNARAFLDGYTKAALVINKAAPTMMACPTPHKCDYSAGWNLAIKDSRLYRCMRHDMVEMVAGEGARYALALQHPAVRLCRTCRGDGSVMVLTENDDTAYDQCTCVDQALDEIEEQIGGKS